MQVFKLECVLHQFFIYQYYAFSPLQIFMLHKNLWWEVKDSMRFTPIQYFTTANSSTV